MRVLIAITVAAMVLFAAGCTAGTAHPAASPAPLPPDPRTASALMTIAAAFNHDYDTGEYGPVYTRWDVRSQAIITRADYIKRHKDCPSGSQALSRTESVSPGGLPTSRARPGGVGRGQGFDRAPGGLALWAGEQVAALDAVQFAAQPRRRPASCRRIGVPHGRCLGCHRVIFGGDCGGHPADHRRNGVGVEGAAQPERRFAAERRLSGTAEPKRIASHLQQPQPTSG